MAVGDFTKEPYSFESSLYPGVQCKGTRYIYEDEHGFSAVAIPDLTGLPMGGSPPVWHSEYRIKAEHLDSLGAREKYPEACAFLEQWYPVRPTEIHETILSHFNLE